MNYKEILEEVKKQCQNVDEFASDLDGERVYPNAKYGTKKYDTIINKILGTIEVVDKYGGEGKGEDWWKIYYFSDHNIYIKIKGYYQSYLGIEFYDGWDSCSEVTPKEKTITVYE